MAEDLSNPQAASGISIRAQIKMDADGHIEAPKNIIKNPAAARAIYFRYRIESLKRIQLYASIEGLLAGNPPYNPQELAKAGLGHIANFNPLDARALYEKEALAYWNLLNEAETICKFVIVGQDPQLLDWADAMARNWDYVVRRWKGFYTQVNTLAAQIVKFGISPVLWPDERDWRWRTIELSRFFVQDQALSDVDQLTCAAVVSTFTVQFLYEVYESIQDKPDSETPWNKDELAHLLLYRANSFAKTNGWGEFANIMDLQRRIQNGDVTFDVIFSDSVQIVSLLYQEYDDGKISHYMFDPVYDGGEFLYFADRQYDNISECFVIFTASPGEFTIHSNRGLGHKIYSSAQAMMQLDCSIVDMAKWSSTPFIKSMQLNTKDAEQIRYYPGVPTNIGTSEFIQNQLGANITQVIEASQFMSQKLQANLANSGSDPSVPDSSIGSISDSQARRMSFKEFGMMKHNIAHFYSNFDTVVENMTAKMWHSKKGYPGYELAAEWKEMCLMDGVPEEIFKIESDNPAKLPRHIKVRATRVAGDGSTLARIMGLQELQVIAPDFGPKEAREYKRQWIMATMGPEYVPAFLQAQEPDETAGGASLAGLENNSMLVGQSPIFSPDNEQRSHIAVHLALANQVVQQLRQQQMDPIAADKIFAVLIPHLQEHVQFLARSPFAKNFVEGIKKPFDQIVQIATLNRKNAANQIEAQMRQQQQQQQKTAQVLNDQQLKNITTQNDEKRKDLKIQAQLQRGAEANQTRAEIMRDKVVKDSDNQKLKIQLDASNKSDEIKQNKMIDNPDQPDLNQQLDDIVGSTPSLTDFQ